jgi:hypothetical protein
MQTRIERTHRTVHGSMQGGAEPTTQRPILSYPDLSSSSGMGNRVRFGLFVGAALIAAGLLGYAHRPIASTGSMIGAGKPPTTQTGGATSGTTTARPLEPAVSEVSYSYGSPVGPGRRGQSVHMMVSFSGGSARAVGEARLDDDARKLYITVHGEPDASSGAGSRLLIVPVTQGQHLGETYTVVVQDQDGHPLGQTDFRNMLAL